MPLALANKKMPRPIQNKVLIIGFFLRDFAEKILPPMERALSSQLKPNG